jgi:hypothetical protein
LRKADGNRRHEMEAARKAGLYGKNARFCW